jgi:hypothetical protein
MGRVQLMVTKEKGEERPTQLHGRLEIGTTKADHDGIRVAVDDGRVVFVTVSRIVATLDLLRRAIPNDQRPRGKDNERT